MKIGSLVERVHSRVPCAAPEKVQARTAKAAKDAGYVHPVKGEIYTVREIRQSAYGGVGILLDEIVNPKLMTKSGKRELTFSIKLFRELQPPMDLSELLKQTTPVTVDNERYFQLEQQNINHSAH